MRFPLEDVTIEITDRKREVEKPLYDDGFYRLSQNEFSMEVEGVGHYYASNGSYIAFSPCEGATETEKELYMNGSAYGAILHQRKIMPLHGSSFIYENAGIMLCGESGAGKSSLTTAFCRNGAAFLTDDVSPLVFEGPQPFVVPLSDRIKLWQDSLQQLNMDSGKLARIAEDYPKFYLPMVNGQKEGFPLQALFILDIHEKPECSFAELTGMDRFTSIRNEIYRWEYLEGMPETEAHYLAQLIRLSEAVKVIKVYRPKDIRIDSLRKILAAYIARLPLKAF